MIEIEGIEKRLEDEGFVISGIKGISMYPFLKQNKDNVIITKVTIPIRTYDVVLYKNEDRYVLHRVIDKKDDTLYIKGDNTYNVEKVKTDRILGVLKAKYNKHGYIDVDRDINKKYYKKSRGSRFFKKIRNYLLRHLPNES